MIALIRFFSLRYLQKHPLRILLSVMAVALGVALYVSSDTANYSTELAFIQSQQRLRGNAELQVQRGRNLTVDTDALAILDQMPGIESAPVLQLSVTMPRLENEGNMMLLGVDFNREASFRMWNVDATSPQLGEDSAGIEINQLAFLMGNGAVVTRRFTERNDLDLNDRFTIDTPTGPQDLVIAAILEDEGPARVYGGNVAVMPMQAVQRLFSLQGTYDRIELIVDGDIESAAQQVRAKLGETYIVEPPPERDSLLDDAVARIRALMGISVVAILVGIFIIYNSVSISVVERVKEIGTLRAFGATRGQVFTAIVLEWAILGLIGSLLGLAIGHFLARALIDLTAREVNTMVPLVVLEEAVTPMRAWIGGILLGLITTMLAAISPARQAMRITPIEMLRQGLFRVKMGANFMTLFWIGIACIIASAILWQGWIMFPNVGLVSAVLGFLGDALALPQLTIWIARLIRPVLRYYRIEPYMASDNIAKFPQRTALTVIALAGALGMMISAGSIVTSFKIRGEEWLRETLPFDLAINAGDLNQSFYSMKTFPESLQDEVQELPGINFTYGIRTSFQDYADVTVMLIAVELQDFQQMHTMQGREGLIPDDKLPELTSGNAIAVSANFARIHRVGMGDSIELRTIDGPTPFQVAGIIEDFSWPQGSIFIDRSIYKDRWNDTGLTYLDVKLDEGVTKATARKDIAAFLKDRHDLFIYDVQELVDLGEDAMNQTLAFTNIQVGVAILIGFLGIVNTLLISVMHRTREIGLLRSVGMTKRQVMAMVVIESVFLSTLAGIIGITIGLIGARWPLALHVAEMSGFMMPLAIPWTSVWVALIASILIGFFASLVPARHAAGINVLEAIGYE